MRILIAVDLFFYARFWSEKGKNLESALEAAKRLIELKLVHYVWDTLSLVYFQLKRYEEALEAAKKAVETGDEHIKIRYKGRIRQIEKAMKEEEKK